MKTNLKWEDFFVKENLELEEKMQSLDIESLSKSKIRLSLENKILDWSKYESWVHENIGCTSLKNDITESDLDGFISGMEQTSELYSSFEFWGEDLLPVFIWDSQLIVFGLQYNEKLIEIPEHVFILAPPEVLTFINSKLAPKSSDEEVSESEHDEIDLTTSGLEGLSAISKPLAFDFKDLTHTFTNTQVTNTQPINTQPTNTQSLVDLSTPTGKTEKEIWDFINERHSEYIFEVKKQFTAYLVLKVDYDKTRVYKMDPDLAKDNVNEQLFTYSLKEDNPFKRVFESGEYESFSVSQLGLNLKNFKYACITALKSGKRVVGFLVAFKDSNLSEIDQMLLEELTKETAS